MFMIVIAVGEVMHNSLLWFRFNLELEDGDTAPLALRAACVGTAFWASYLETN